MNLAAHQWISPVLLGLSAFAGCGIIQAPVLNPAFLNTLQGGVYPLTPGPNVPYILVRTVNETDQVVEFVVTIERQVYVLDADGGIQFEDLNGNFTYDLGEPLITRPERETVRLTTTPMGRGRDLGVLFQCQDSVITRIGLGENLLPSDSAAFVGGEGAGGAVGFGVGAAGVSPLSFAANNFDCGDTVIFRAIQSSGIAGGVSLQSLLLPGSEQPSSFTGSSTFENYQAFLESQVREDEP